MYHFLGKHGTIQILYGPNLTEKHNMYIYIYIYATPLKSLPFVLLVVTPDVFPVHCSLAAQVSSAKLQTWYVYVYVSVAILAQAV